MLLWSCDSKFIIYVMLINSSTNLFPIYIHLLGVHWHAVIMAVECYANREFVIHWTSTPHCLKDIASSLVI